MAAAGILTAINRYPVKSMRGEALTQADVEPWGLAQDRRWMITDSDGRFLTAREIPRLLLIVPELKADGGLRLRAPDGSSHDVPPPCSSGRRDVVVWRSELSAVAADPGSDDWLSRVLGRSVRLVYLDDPARRHANPDFAGPGAPVSFADGYPLLITNSRSLDALNDAILEGPRSDEGPLPMIRFRPNLVVEGPEAWSEEGWRRIKIGEAIFRAVKGCARCVMTTTDPDNAARGKEPIATLARIRRFDRETWFGMNLVPETAPGRVNVGDELEILEAVDHSSGPPR